MNGEMKNGPVPTGADWHSKGTRLEAFSSDQPVAPSRLYEHMITREQADPVDAAKTAFGAGWESSTTVSRIDGFDNPLDHIVRAYDKRD